MNQTGLATKPAAGGPSPAVNKAHVLKSIWHYSATIVLTYWVTFTLFPGSLTEDVASRALGDWYGILLITAFNLSDLAGRVASNYLLVARKTVLGLAVGRIALVSLFFLRETRRRHPTPTDRVPTRSRCSGWRTGRGRGSRRCSRWRWGSGPPTGT